MKIRVKTSPTWETLKETFHMYFFRRRYTQNPRDCANNKNTIFLRRETLKLTGVFCPFLYPRNSPK